MFIEDLKHLLANLNDEYSKNEWVVAEFIEKYVNNIVSYEAYKNIDLIVNILLEEDNRYAWTEIFDVMFSLIKKSNTTEVSPTLKNSLSIIGFISKNISIYDYNQFLELTSFYRIGCEIDFSKDIQIDTNKSIELIENTVWPEPIYDSYVIKKSYEYRKLPINLLTVEACRLLIEQEIGINYILPTTIDMLKNDILISGDLYDGDLLNAVVNIKRDYWECNKSLYNELKKLIETCNVNDEEIEKAKGILNKLGNFA